MKEMMTQNWRRRTIGLAVILFALVAVGALSHTVGAQQSQSPRKVSADSDGSSPDDKTPFASIEAEMKAKRAIKYAEKEYQDNLDRARDLSTQGAAIVTSFKQKNALSQEDIKKLGKVEKLARKIREAAGGSEDDTKMEKPPADLAAAVEMLGNLSQSLKEKVEKTPKHVISAAVIDEANVLLELIRIVRTLPSKA